jgi:uncharacterized protein
VTHRRDDAAAALHLLRQRVDAHFEGAQRRTPEQMSCARGCHECCHVRLSVFSIEARPIEEALVELSHADPEIRARVRHQADDPRAADRCPMLVDGCCAVYDARPLICRSHGLPIALDGEHAGEVHWCELNFRDEAPPAASILRLEAVNGPLAVMALMWDGRGERIDLADLARSSK